MSDGHGGPRDGAGRGRLKTLDPVELRRVAACGVSLKRGADLLGVGWAVCKREALRHGVAFRRVYWYMKWPQRYHRGAANHKAKLTQAQVNAIRRSQEPAWYWAERFGVNERTIRKVRSGASW